MNTQTSIYNPVMARRMLVGAIPAVILMALFVSGVDNPDPAWGKYWMVRPLLVIAFAGAMGGLFYHLMEHFRQMGGWQKGLSIVACIVVYIVGLWMGSVLGLVGTLWN